MIRALRLVAAEIWLPGLVILAWWWLSRDSTSLFFPPLQTIVERFGDTFLSAAVTDYLTPSLLNLAVGFAVATVVGIGLGIVVALSWWTRSLVEPMLNLLRALPPPVLIPIAIVAVGIGSTMKIGIIAVGALFPILLNTIDGVRSVDPTVRETSAAYRIPRRVALRSVLVPAASPQIFAGLRVGLQVSLLLMVVSEMVASTSGIGYFILQSQQVFASPEMWAGILMLGLLGYLLNGLLTLAERRALRWHSSMQPIQA